MEPKRFTQEEETLIVKQAMELTATIMYEDIELKKAQSESFRSKPAAPTRKVLPKPTPVAPKYPQKPKTTYTYSNYLKDIINPLKTALLSKKLILIAAVVILIVLSAIMPALGIFFFGFLFSILTCSIIPALIVTFFRYQGKCKELNSALSQNPDYLQAVKEAEKQAAEQNAKLLSEMQEQQAELDRAHEQQMIEYETVTLPQYEAARITWAAIREKKIAFLQEEIQYNTEALNDLYDNSKIISNRYRELWILKWLYEDMSSSDHDIRYATELLDRERQLDEIKKLANQTEAAIYNMTSSLTGSLDAVYDAIEHGNSLQEESVEILTKTRRDTNISNIVGIVQRHNTNKMLKSITDK